MTIIDLLEKYGKDTTAFGSITRKQAGAIFRLTKTGDLTPGEQTVDFLYTRLASDSKAPTTDATRQNIAAEAAAAVSACFANDFEAAKALFNRAVDTYFSHYSDQLFDKESVCML